MLHWAVKSVAANAYFQDTLSKQPFLLFFSPSHLEINRSAITAEKRTLCKFDNISEDFLSLFAPFRSKFFAPLNMNSVPPTKNRA